MAKEINLVPDIKNEFLKTLKFRNFVFFLCIVIASGSLIVTLIFLSIAGGQQGFITAKQNTLKALEQKINEFSNILEGLSEKEESAIKGRDIAKIRRGMVDVLECLQFV